MKNISVIDLPLPRAGYYNFFSSWLIQRNNSTILVDPGPAASIPHLITVLNSRGISRIDHLLLTHIHLDHAGGAGQLVEQFPVSNVYCQEKAVKHIVNPTRLWEASLATLGDSAEMQGAPKAVPEDIVHPAVDTIATSDGDISVFASPGHAAHHISFLIEDILVVGEALGVIIPGFDNYLRPATPHKFHKESYISSIEKLMNIKCNTLCFGHYGLRERSDIIFKQALEQIKLWVTTCQSMLDKQNDDIAKIITLLSDIDPLFANFKTLPSDLKMREQEFVKNSVNGILEYLRAN